MFDHDERRRAAHEERPADFDRFRGGRFGGGPRGRGFRGGGGRGGPWGGPPWAGGRGGRARRGDVRAALLALLAERPMHGYEMIQELGARTDGAWNPSPGSVYPTLTMLEEEGLVTASADAGKRQFNLTDAGRQAVADRDGAPPWEEFSDGADPATADLREALATSMHAIKQVFRAGSPAQQAKAAEVLTEARRKLYEILATED